jgi:hypothetical protein
MDFNAAEVSQLEVAINHRVEREIEELSEIQLAFIGGGVGEVVVG